MDAERVRIARELHDVVAHSMAMINVQATAASLQLADDPARVAEALQEIRRASKVGLRELRAILDVLRQVDGDGTEVSVPDLRAIQALADAASAAGTPATVRADSYSVPLPPSVALAAYRIVQESLTNVIRHAGRVCVTVSLRHEDGSLVVDVVNESGSAHATFGDGAGAGLTGMKERAAALGGSLEAGPRPGGGFRVHAELPMATTPPGPEPAALDPAGPEAVGVEPGGPERADVQPGTGRP